MGYTDCLILNIKQSNINFITQFLFRYFNKKLPKVFTDFFSICSISKCN